MSITACNISWDSFWINSPSLIVFSSRYQEDINLNKPSADKYQIYYQGDDIYKGQKNMLLKNTKDILKVNLDRRS